MIGPPKPGYHWQFQMAKNGQWFWGHARNLDLTPYPGILANLEEVNWNRKEVADEYGEVGSRTRNERIYDATHDPLATILERAWADGRKA